MFIPEHIAERVMQMSDQQLDEALNSIGADEASAALGIQAAREKERRAAVAEAQRRAAAPVQAADAQARAVWVESGGDPSDETGWRAFLAEDRRRRAHDRLEQQRLAARRSVRF